MTRAEAEEAARPLTDNELRGLDISALSRMTKLGRSAQATVPAWKVVSMAREVLRHRGVDLVPKEGS